MPTLDIGNLKLSNYEGGVPDWEVVQRVTDGVSELQETEWDNPNWPKYLGYFKTNSDFQSAILLKTMWVLGQGYETDPETKIQLENISGWGKDTFDDICKNLESCALIGGNGYAEIIFNDSGDIINLKPLDPGTIKHVVDGKGMIKRYEQWSKLGDKPKKVASFNPNEIFHVVTERVADEIHGLERTEAIEKVLSANEENFNDMKKLMQRQVKPLILWKLKTEDQTKIKNFVRKIETAKSLGEDMFIPDDEDIVTYEVVFTPSNALQSPFQWRDNLRNDFYRTVNLPQILAAAGGQSTESESKVIYLGHEVIIRARQRYWEKQIWNQLAIKLKFVQPASLETGLRVDEQKDAGQGLNFQPNETTAGVGR